MGSEQARAERAESSRVSLHTSWQVSRGCVAEALPADAGVRRLPGSVSDATHQPAEVVEVGAAQSHHWASLRRQPQPPADLVSLVAAPAERYVVFPPR